MTWGYFDYPDVGVWGFGPGAWCLVFLLETIFVLLFNPQIFALLASKRNIL